ncbi:MAG: hypothetical protein Q4D51_02090 [Eubacteriales bacterium]|nr:hypothetical protein [Eubacteriales bacterium]
MVNLLEKLEDRNWTGLELALSFVVAILSGVVLGVLLSPKGNRHYGCYNGNSNGNSSLEYFEEAE